VEALIVKLLALKILRESSNNYLKISRATSMTLGARAFSLTKK
jgi:hypothetical protein